MPAHPDPAQSTPEPPSAGTSHGAASLAAAASAAAQADAGAPDLLRGRLMQRSLKLLLDRVPGSRHGLPHLAALEGALAELGAGAVKSISARGLAKIHTQLRVLPLEAADSSIQDLLALVQRAVRMQAREQRTHQLSPHDPQSTVVISEGSESDFMDALREARQGRASPASH